MNTTAGSFEIVPPRAGRTPLVAHVPHGSTFIPPDARELILLDDAALQRELVRMTDWHTEDLFSGVHDLGGTGDECQPTALRWHDRNRIAIRTPRGGGRRMLEGLSDAGRPITVIRAGERAVLADQFRDPRHASRRSCRPGRGVRWGPLRGTHRRRVERVAPRVVIRVFDARLARGSMQPRADSEVMSTMPEHETMCPFDSLMDDPQAAPNFVASGSCGSLFVNTNQSHRGRCIYVFHRHVEDPTLLRPNEFSDFASEMFGFMRLLRRTFHPELVNVALLGNRVPHLHWHIVPRYLDDPNLDGPPWPHVAVPLSDEECVLIVSELQRNLVES